MKNTHLFLVLLAGLAFGSPGAVKADIVIMWTNKSMSGFAADEVVVVDAAISSWESLIDDLGPGAPSRTTITVSITEASDPALGTATDLMADAMGIPLSGSITIDDGTGTGLTFFKDPIPETSFEFDVTGFPHYGTVKPGGDASGFDKDLYTVVNHELGHLLGFSDDYALFDGAHLGTGAGSILMYSPPMSALMGIGAGHLSPVAHPFDLMADAVEPLSARRLPSGLDLTILAGIYGYTVDLASLPSITPIPLPGALGLLLCGLAAISGACRRGRLQQT